MPTEKHFCISAFEYAGAFKKSHILNASDCETYSYQTTNIMYHCLFAFFTVYQRVYL